jgi:hypothetical protein
MGTRWARISRWQAAAEKRKQTELKAFAARQRERGIVPIAPESISYREDDPLALSATQASLYQQGLKSGKKEFSVAFDQLTPSQQDQVRGVAQQLQRLQAKDREVAAAGIAPIEMDRVTLQPTLDLVLVVPGVGEWARQSNSFDDRNSLNTLLRKQTPICSQGRL